MERDDFFDFSKEVFPSQEAPSDEKSVNSTPQGELLTQESEIRTAYLLVNALLNLLIRKSIIYPHEVNALVAELHADYMLKRKKGRGEL